MSQVLATAQQLVSFVDSLIVPLSKTTLLLPVSAISEVVDNATPEESADQPEWCYGEFRWREQVVTLVSFEALTGKGRPAINEQTRFAIIKASDDKSEFGYYGVVTQGYPRSTRIMPTSDFRPAADQIEQDGVLMVATLDEQPVVMPDLAYIESQLQQN